MIATKNPLIKPDPVYWSKLIQAGAYRYSRWKDKNARLLIVISGQLDEATSDYCEKLKILDVGAEVATEVWAADWLDWISCGVVKQDKSKL